ncbi:UNVERIFIED_CONTAM: hypothetical protein FKN15_014459 [Acipenser sinensis]
MTNAPCPPKSVPSADRFFPHCGLTMQPPKSLSASPKTFTKNYISQNTMSPVTRKLYTRNTSPTNIIQSLVSPVVFAAYHSCRERPPDGAVESCSSPSLTRRFVFPTALEVYCKRIRPQHPANCSLRLHYTLDNK